jgi:adenosine 3'-phospho 5'-phosphosulfate transporter B2
MAPQTESPAAEVAAEGEHEQNQPPPVEQGTTHEQVFWCGFYAVGIIGTLLLYGVLQERIMTIGYGPNETLFEYSVFCIFVNRCVAVTYAVVMAIAKGETLYNKAPLWRYGVVSFSNVFASTCQYEALKYLAFAVQQLGKSFKMMPVMIWGIIISQKAYSLMDWLIALGVTLGVTEFLLTGPITSSSNHDNGTSLNGFVFLLAFLALDGLTSTMQEKVFKEYKTSKYNQMLYVNMFSAGVSLVTLVTTGTLGPALSFAANYPELVWDTSLLSVSAVASQFFIYSQVKEFGALVFAATMNVRQVTSIIVSYVTYGHHITGLQVLGLLITFSALFYKSYIGLMGSPTKAEQAPLVPKPGEGPASGDMEKQA